MHGIEYKEHWAGKVLTHPHLYSNECPTQWSGVCVCIYIINVKVDILSSHKITLSPSGQISPHHPPKRNLNQQGEQMKPHIAHFNSLTRR